jgi:hypothetical protein
MLRVFTRCSLNELLDYFLNDFKQSGRVKRLNQPTSGPGRAPGLLHEVARLGSQHQKGGSFKVRVIP